MSIALETSPKSRIRSRRKAQSEYRVLFALSFALFLLPLMLARVVRWVKAPIFGSQEGGKSLFAEAREAANAALPYAFIG